MYDDIAIRYKLTCLFIILLWSSEPVSYIDTDKFGFWLLTYNILCSKASLCFKVSWTSDICRNWYYKLISVFSYWTFNELCYDDLFWWKSYRKWKLCFPIYDCSILCLDLFLISFSWFRCCCCIKFLIYVFSIKEKGWAEK